MTRADLFLNFIQSLKIRNKEAKIQPLILNTAQQIVWAKYVDKINRGQSLWVIVLKARQEGISTLTEALMLTRTFERDLINTQIIAHEKPATQKIFKMAKMMVQSSDLNKVATIGQHAITIGRSEMTIATAGSEHAARGGNITCAHLSEVAFWPDPAAMLGILQCIPDHVETLCVLESTANGKAGDGELFYNEWERAHAGESDFLPIFLPWFALPEYSFEGAEIEEPDEEEEELRAAFQLTGGQLSWRRKKIATYCQGDVEKFHQEFPSTPEEAFIQSGLPFFTSAQLLHFTLAIDRGTKYRISPDGTLEQDHDGPIEIWIHPEPGHTYLIGADSSMGIDKADRSRSACQVLDMETLEQVAELDAPMSPHILADYLVGLGRLYHDALLVPEVQGSGGGGGRQLLDYILRHDYFHLHRWSGSGPDRIQPKPGHLYGWETTARTRPRMLAELRRVVLQQCCTIHSAKLLKQLSAFGQSSAERYEALQGHDDLVFAWCIALVSRSENYYPETATEPYLEDIELESLGIRVVDLGPDEVLRRHQEKVLRGQARPMTGPLTFMEM